MYVNPRETARVQARKAKAYGHLTPAEVKANKDKSRKEALSKLVKK
jgi:hypothetical protein